MKGKLHCPNRDQLGQMLEGFMPAEEMESLQEHVADCAHCLEIMRAVTTEDAFVQVVRAGGRAENLDPQDTDPTLLARLLRLYGETQSTVSLFSEIVEPVPERVEELSRLLAAPGEPDELGRLGSYGILRSLGRGGMGVVFAARQRQPRRIVALKMIVAGWTEGGERLARFQSEIEIVAQLQHPNIVPVHEVGAHEGRPYYTMDYLQGGSLAQRLAAAPLTPRLAAELARVLATAVHFAHQRGIVHRDLKPANILLADDGSPKIADFGLAKQLNSEAEEAAPYRTETGAILGTPAYMAPEQAVGGRDVGPATDVYALGAILYECLTGRPPFRAATLLETLEQVRSQEPVPIARLQPKVPRDLQTICLKCLHKEQNRRYESAAALCDDLDRFLRGEPIQARPVPTRERVWKWARRKPGLASLLAVCCLLLATLIVGGFVYNSRLRAAVGRAEDKETETRRQYRHAHETLDRMLDRLEAQRLAEVPRLRELQRSLLEDALTFYQDILQQSESPDPAVRKDTAVACKRAADIQNQLGQYDSAGENYRRAIELTESLPAEKRESLDVRGLQAGCYLSWSMMLKRSEEVEKYSRMALELLEQLVREKPDDPVLLNELAKTEQYRGNICIRSKPAEAETHYSRAISLRLTLVRDHPEVESYQASLAGDYVNLGLLYQQTGRAAEAAPTSEKAEALLRPLVDRHPAERTYVLSLVALYVNWSYDLARASRPQEALERLDLAVRLADSAVLREPQDVAARSRALSAHGARAEIREFVGRFDDSVKDWDRIIELGKGSARNGWRGSRTRVLNRAGDHARAVAEAGELARLPDATDDWLYFLAGVYTEAIRPALTDKKLPATQREQLAERYAAQAMALMRKLQNKGYFQDAGHAKALRADDNLQPLRAREDFQALLGELKQKPREK